MQASFGVRYAGERYVHGLGLQALLPFSGSDPRPPFGERSFDLLRYPVRSRADLAALLRREIPDALLYVGQCGRAAQVLHTYGLQIGRGASRRNVGESLPTKFVYALDRRHQG